MFAADSTVLFAYSALLELISLLVASAIGYYSYKIYKYSSERKYLYFAMSFLFITLSFLIHTLRNIEVYFGRTGSIPILDINITSGILTLNKAAYITQMFLMLSGYMLLTLLTFKLEDKRPVPLFIYFTVISTILSYRWSLVFSIPSFVLLCYIAYNYYENYLKKKSTKTLLIFSAFSVITLSQILFILTRFFEEFYFIGDIIQLVGYIILLLGLVLVFKK